MSTRQERMAENSAREFESKLWIAEKELEELLKDPDSDQSDIDEKNAEINDINHHLSIIYNSPSY